MGCYRLGFCLLLCIPCVWANQYWTHVPSAGSVQLTELSAEQHSVLAQHLKLGPQETTAWLNALPALLDNLSCSTLDAQSQPLPSYIDPSYKLISYAGALKFFADDPTSQRVWWLPWNLLPVLSELNTQLNHQAVQIHQPLLINEQQLGIKNQLMIVSGSSGVSPNYFALQLTSLNDLRQLWSAGVTEPGFSDLAGASAQPLLLRQSREPAIPELSLFLPNTAGAADKTLIYKTNLMTGQLQARLTAKLAISNIAGAMALYDQNRDSVPESLLFSTKTGQIWQAQFAANQFYQVQLVADLSALNLSDIQSISALYAAVPIAGSGSDFHSRRSQWLILVGALQQQKAVLTLVKKSAGTVVYASDLLDRGLANTAALVTPQDWQRIQQKSGWFSLFNGRLNQSPIVAAGVIYLSVLQPNTEQSCSQSQASLLALHLHHASPVYPWSILSQQQAAGRLQVKSNAQGGFSLIEQHQQRVLIETLLEISPECAHCSKTLQQDSFPRWQLMGTYHNEEGAYE